MTELDNFFVQVFGDYTKKSLPLNGRYTYVTSYSKALFLYPTIEMVVVSPYLYEVFIDDYILNKEECFYFFLYDLETDIVIGDVVSIDYDDDWRDELEYYIYTAEDRLTKCECPICNFWLVQRANIYGHKFIGCSGFPDCNYSIEIDKLFD
jgi:hypothetical protein